MALFHKAEKAEAGNSQTLEIMRRFRKNRSAMIGLTIFLVICLLAIFADVITPYSNATTQVKDARLLAPCAEHIFGTDHLGRDMFARVLHGSRYSISFAIAVSACSLLFSVVLGGVAGYYGGAIDNVVMRVLDVIMCIPGDLLALCIVAAFGTNLGNLLIALIIGRYQPQRESSERRSWAFPVRTTLRPRSATVPATPGSSQSTSCPMLWAPSSLTRR